MDVEFGIKEFSLDDPCWEMILNEINKSSLKMENSYVNSNDGGIVPDDLRISDVSFLDDSTELSNMLYSLVMNYNYNISKWKWDVRGLSDSPQYTIYNKGGQYGWHSDTEPSNSDNYNPLSVRKISISIFLNDPDEYEGGELDIEFKGPRDKQRYETFKLPKGSVLIFPSQRWHRVRPVISGIRKSLVVWFSGPSFR